MANSDAVWGIDIGQCAIKALKCRPHEKEPGRLVVESFDYIEYPKILSQPEAEPDELVRDALEQFLSRNDLTGDRVAISVAGQSGLARFIKLPPVESKKIPDIVKYEARQQIPFSLDDVVWDYQQLTGGSEEDGFALEPEVGIFAMKRDQVARALKPFEEAGIEVDVIQLVPLAVYNYACFELFDDLQSRAYDPQNPPESTVVVSLGTDTTDLVVTNGYRVWQRNIPIGGSHFTRALSRELKLTFVKAEHLKRNAMQADDPKAVFQAMRPVFSDLLAEIQRSLGYFSSIDKAAKIGDMIALGNAMKLPGLQRYLSQNLEHEVKPIEEFKNLSAGSTTARTQFKDNLLSFAVSYGLCIQGLGKSELRTSLLPEEIVRSRLVRAKKPWAVAGVAAVMMALTFNYFTHVSAWQATVTDAMESAETNADRVQTTATGYESENQAIHTAFDQIKTIGENLVSNVEGRLMWLELLKGFQAALPRDDRPIDQREETLEDISARNELHFVSMEAQEFTDLQSEWFSIVEPAYNKSRGIGVGGDGGEGDGGLGDGGAEEYEASPEDASGEGAAGGLSGPGWVIQLIGYHYHNLNPKNQTSRFVNNTIVKALEEGVVELPDGPNDRMIKVSLADLGISHPWLVKDTRLTDEVVDPEAALTGKASRSEGYGGGGYSGERRGGGFPGGPADAEDEESKLFTLKRYDFVLQFVWQPTPRSERRQIAEERRLQAEQEQAETAVGAEDPSEVL